MTNKEKLIELHKRGKALLTFRDETLKSMAIPEGYSLYIREFSPIPSCTIYKTYNTSSKVQIDILLGDTIIKSSGISKEEEKLIVDKLNKWLLDNTSVLLELYEKTVTLETDKAIILDSMELPKDYELFILYRYSLPMFSLISIKNVEEGIDIKLVPGVEPSIVASSGFSAKEAANLETKITKWLEEIYEN